MVPPARERAAGRGDPLRDPGGGLRRRRGAGSRPPPAPARALPRRLARGEAGDGRRPARGVRREPVERAPPARGPAGARAPGSAAARAGAALRRGRARPRPDRRPARRGAEKRERALVALESRMVVRLSGRATGRLPAVNVQTRVASPDRARLQVRAILGVLLDAAVRGDTLVAWLPSERLGVRVPDLSDSLG